MNKKPKLTVLMPVYNAEKYLNEAIESILNQTFSDFEFLIINDGSTDNSINIIKNYSDPRIILIDHETNEIYMKRLNEGLNIANGEYIARMDADDISRPTRFEKQVKFLDENPEIGIVGTYWKTFGSSNKEVKPLCKPDEVKVFSIFHSPFAHPTVMFKKSLFDKNKLRYNENCHYAEDYDLWARALNCFNGANLDEVLLDYRVHSKNVSIEKAHIQSSMDKKIKQNILINLRINPTEEELDLHLEISIDYNLGQDLKKIQKGLNWLNEIYTANQKAKIYSEDELKIFLEKIAYFIAYNGHFKGLKIYNEYKKSPFSNKEGKKKIFKACYKAQTKILKCRLKALFHM